MNSLLCSRLTLLPIICFLSIIFYIRSLPDFIREVIVYIPWGIGCLECISFFVVNKKLRVNSIVFKYLALTLFTLFLVFILQLFGNVNYFNSPTIRSVVLSLGVFIIGFIYGQKLNEEDIKVVCKWYLIGSFVLAVFITVTYSSMGFYLDSRLYLDIGKNAIGQIFSTSVCIILFLLSDSGKKRFFSTLLYTSLGIFLVVIMFLIRSRTSLLCFGVALFYIIVSKRASKILKKRLLKIAVAGILILVFNENIRNTLVQNILLANRDISDLDDITSGRVAIYNSFWRLMEGNELTGNGGLYYESFYLSTLIQFGYLVGGLFNLLVLQMLVYIKYLSSKVIYGQLLMTIAISYSLNGVLEGLPPFGPGTKNFLLWLLFGAATSHIFLKNTKLVK